MPQRYIRTDPNQSYFSYGEAIAQGMFGDIAKWSKIGFTPTMTTTESDIWSAAGAYTFASASMGIQVVSSTASDTCVAIRGTLPATPLTCDAGGTTTTLIDVSENFLAASAVVAGDCVIVDPFETATLPEWGFVSSVGADGKSLILNNGLSGGGSFATARKYFVLDYGSNAGAIAVKVEYLDKNYAEKTEIITLSGTASRPSQNVDYFRINSFRIIAAGSSNVAKGNLSLKDSAGVRTYSYITANYTRARNIMYTVPTGKILWVSQVNVGFGFVDAAKAQNQYCRFWTRANREPSTGFLTGSIFYPYSEIISVTGQIDVLLEEPTKLLAKTDIKMSGISSAAGVATCALRGYLETV